MRHFLLTIHMGKESIFEVDNSIDHSEFQRVMSSPIRIVIEENIRYFHVSKNLFHHNPKAGKHRIRVSFFGV